MAYIGLTDFFYNELEKMKRTIKYSPLNLGGIIGSGGGVDGRGGGFTGRLPQTRVTYDKSELAVSTSAGSPTLLDNLNHIRANIAGKKLLHGVVNRTNGVWYNYSTRTIGVSGIMEYYFEGLKYNASGILKVHPDTSNHYYLYYDSSNTLQFTASGWSILTDVPIASVYYDSDTPIGVAFEERHSSTRNREAHYEFHYTTGSFWHAEDGGLALDDYEENPSAPIVDSDNEWSLSAGYFHDEDIEHEIPATSAGGPYLVAWRSGADGIWQFTTSSSPFLNAAAGYIYYNQFTGGAWQQTELATTNWVNYYIIHLGAFKDKYKTAIVMGQEVHSSLADAQAEDITSITWGNFPDEEIISSYRITFRASASYSTTGKVRIEDVADTRTSTSRQIVNAQPASNHNSLSGLQGGTTGEYYHLTSDELALIGSIETGSTVPATPAEGDFFLHTPTGRTVLLQYDGSNWQPIINYGSTTVYVDNSVGVDEIDAGGAIEAGAFNSIQYALDTLSGVYGGDVTINISAGTYAESIDMSGKYPTGEYNITFSGTLSLEESVSSATVAAGSGATQGTVTKASQFVGDSYRGYLCYFVTDDEYRIIDSNTDDALTVVGLCPSSTSQDVNIYSWDTTISSRFDLLTQDNVVFTNINFTDRLVATNSSMTLSNCSFVNDGIELQVLNGSQVSSVLNSVFEQNGSSSGGYCVNAINLCSVRLDGCLLHNSTGATGRGIQVAGMCSIDILSGTKIDQFQYGVVAATNSVVTFYQTAGYDRIYNCTSGVYSTTGSMIVGTANNQYSGNSTDETATSASYGYVD